MNIALIGYGKMGKAIHEIAKEKNAKAGNEHFNISLIVDIDNRETVTPEALKQSDVAIEFTSPHTAVDNIKWCLEAGVPVVVGSTGWLDRLEEIKSLVHEKNGSLLYSPNYSIGVNIFFEINRQLARIMEEQPDYEVFIEEIHHTEKKDAPSGTALYAGLDILRLLGRKTNWKNEKTGKSDILDIISLREPHVPGTHTITYSNDIDRIEIKHQAYNRKGFATGALLAANWLFGKNGVFTMDDVLGFNR
jgi:4-hydroxy-tetrahydrodipicolinate reductase